MPRGVYELPRKETTTEDRIRLIEQKKFFIGYGISLLRKYSEVFDPEKDEIEIWIDQKLRSGHTFVVGTTGSGKTVKLSNWVVQDICYDNRLIYVDPKGDRDLLKGAIAAARVKGRFRPGEFLLLSPLYLDVSVELNPLYGLDADEAAVVLVSAIPEGKEPFFKKVAFMTLLAIMLALKSENPHYYPSVSDVAAYFSFKKLKQLKDVVEQTLRDIASSSPSESIHQYASDAQMVLDHLVHTSEEYFEKISMTLKAEVDVLSTGAIGRIIGRAKENILYKRLENDENVIFFAYLGALRYGDEIVGRAARMIFSSIQRLTGKMYQKFKVFDPPLAIYGDEAKNLFYDGIEDLFNKVRGANVYLTFATQSLGDVAAALGQDKMLSILGNVNIIVIMRAIDRYTSEYVERSSEEVFIYRPNFLQHQLGLNQTKQKAIPGPILKKLPTGAFFCSLYGKWYQLYSPYEEIPKELDFDLQKVFFPSEERKAV